MKRGNAQAWRKVWCILSVSRVGLVPELHAAQADARPLINAPPMAERLTQAIPACMAVDGVPGAVVVLIEGGVPV